MQDDLKAKIEEYRGQLEEMKGYLDIETKRTELERLEAEAGQPGFWNDQNKAQVNITATKALKMVLDPFNAIAGGTG